jgi:putative ABC transport system substrate-binding protein
MQRRQFLSLLGAAAAQWPLRADARSGRPVVGFLNSTNPGGMASYLAAFHRGLKATGFTKDHNVWFRYAWAKGDYAQLPGLAGRLVQENVDLIASSGGLVAAEAAAAATRDIPVIFLAGLNPRGGGIWSQPNATGITTNTPDHLPQRLEELRKWLPGRTIALLVNPASPQIAEIEKYKLGVPIFEASTMAQVQQAYRAAGAKGYAILVSADALYTANSERLVSFEKKYNVPGGYPWGNYSGGFLVHGADLMLGYQTLGRYVGETLKKHGYGRRRRLGATRGSTVPIVGAGAPDTTPLPVATLELGSPRVNLAAARRHGIVVPK